LKIFSAGIKDVAAKTGVPFVDQYNPYLAICVSAHAAKPRELLYSNGGDRIHPSALGQTIQVWIILKALGASALVSRAEINSATQTVVAAELAEGWNLAASAGPITQQGQELLKQIKEKDELFYSRWRKVQLFEVPEWAQKPADVRTAELARLDRKIAEVEGQIEKLRKPHSHHFELRAAIADGPFKPTFESLKQYQVPEWFMDAKLGIFMHWGPASVGGTSGWFGREMYRQGSDSYKFVVKNFGHPSKFGYKDICKLFKAEKFDEAQADALVKLYKKAGARYVVPVAVHHDNFDMWDSKYQPRWNAKVTTGKDIIGIWKKAADANGLRFGVASHVARTYRWFLASHQADKTGPLKGVPYDGADPQFSDLYGVPWKTVAPTFPGWSGDCAYEVSHDVGPPEWERQFERRMRDLLDRYQPDLYYVDGGIPFHVHPAGLNILAHFYNSSIAHHDGKLEAVANIKCDWQPNIAILDYEGAAKGGRPEYCWQSDQSINGEWFWTRYDKPEEYTSARRTITTLKAGRFDAGAIASITMLGARGNLTWKQDGAGLHVTLPDAAPGADAYSLKVTFKTPHIPNLHE
jgi:hypothetical protein